MCVWVTAGHGCVLQGSLKHEWNILSPMFLSRWAGNKAWQKMRRGWWLVRWLGTGMAILSLLTHSWGQDTEGMKSQHRGERPQASPSSVNCCCSAKRKLIMLKRKCFFSLLEDQHGRKAFVQQHNSLFTDKWCAKRRCGPLEPFYKLLLNGPEVKLSLKYSKIIF